MADYLKKNEPNEDLTLDGIEIYFNKGIRDSIIYDIKPILHLDQEHGGYFGVIRQICCYIDHFGYLYTFKKDKPTERQKEFIKKIFGEIDPYYKNEEIANIIVELYRNGTVHEFNPKNIIDKKGNKLSWIIYKGERRCYQPIKNKQIVIRHMKPFKNDGKYYLPISTKCFFEDLLLSLNRLLELIKTDKNIENNFHKWRKEWLNGIKRDKLDIEKCIISLNNIKEF